MKRWAKIAVACFVVVLLAAFGINNIGGDTWISAGAPLPPGFQRDVGGPVHHRDTARLVPVILVLALAAGALVHAYLRRPSETNPAAEEDETAAAATVTTPATHDGSPQRHGDTEGAPNPACEAGDRT